MSELILARHGETEWNVEEIFRGRADIELNQTGLKQAELLAKYFSRRQIDAIYSSPLKRAVKTAEAIADYHRIQVEIIPALIDYDCGEWQGLLSKEVKERYQEIYQRWVSQPHRVKIPGGESLADVRKRVTPVVYEIAARHRGTVVLVAHRVVNKVLICALLGLANSSFWNIRQDVSAITTFSYENGRFILTEHNNTCFLRGKTGLGDF